MYNFKLDLLCEHQNVRRFTDSQRNNEIVHIWTGVVDKLSLFAIYSHNTLGCTQKTCVVEDTVQHYYPINFLWTGFCCRHLITLTFCDVELRVTWLYNLSCCSACQYRNAPEKEWTSLNSLIDMWLAYVRSTVTFREGKRSLRSRWFPLRCLCRMVSARTR